MHMYLEDMDIIYGGNGDNADNEPPIESCNSNGFKDNDVDMQGYDNQSSDSDFYESKYNMEDDDDHVYEVNVELEIDRDMGSSEGCSGQDVLTILIEY